MAKKRINYKKGLLKTSLMLILTLFMTLSIGFLSSSANTNDETCFMQVNVKPGDNLWLIADRYDNNKIDLRKLIYEIKCINNIDDIIYPGQVLKVPIY